MNDRLGVIINENLERLCSLLDRIDNDYVTKRSRMNALVAEMSALDTERSWMNHENMERLCDGKALAWDEDDFKDMADKYRLLAERFRNER